MDRYTVEVVIFGREVIKEHIQNGKKLERLTLDCKMGDSGNISQYNQADLFVVESAIGKEAIAEVFQYKADYAQVIIVADCEECVAFDEAYLEQFYEVWIKNSPMISYRIGILMKRFLGDLDAELGEKQLDVLIDSVPDLVWYKDVRGAHIKVNDTFCKTVNKTKEMIKDRGHCYIWDLDMAEYEQGEYVCMETEEIVIAEQKTFLFPEKVKIGSEMRQLNTYKSAILGRRGETVGTVGIAHDVTDVWNTHEEFKTLINNLPFPMMLVNENYEFISGNRGFENLFNYSTEEHEGFNIEQFGKLYFGQQIQFADKHNVSRSVSMQRHGMTLHYIMEKSPVYDVFQKLTGYFYIFRDITMRYEYEARLRQLSEIDELSRLNNRKAITKFMEEGYIDVIENNQTLAIFMLDIDCFKLYNDNYGHLEGDEVIQMLGSILREYHNGEDIIAARYGGEEFFLVVKSRTEEEIKQLAEELLEKVQGKKIPHEFSTISEYVTCSIGVSYYNRITEETLGRFIREADGALYEAKAKGKNCYILDSHIAE